MNKTKTTKKDLPAYYDDFSIEDLEIIKEKNPAQYTLIMARLKQKALETKEASSPNKSITDFDDFI